MNRSLLLNIVIFSLVVFSVFIMMGSKKHPAVLTAEHPNYRLHAQIVELLEKAQEVTVTKVRPVWGGECRFEKLTYAHQLGEEQKSELVQILLQPESYIFNKKKMCLFVPELWIQMDEDLEVLVNRSGKQLEFVFQGKYQRVECDPAYDKIMKIFEDIEWEKLDDKD